ncbi:hypothetical protein [Candidatus Palauibacter sp.]|uniref:hypothetical protein n=1 Tax=Candidatus Palauibacter sp. TaxID=3101350 RepID=UPI003CC55A5D
MTFDAGLRRYHPSQQKHILGQVIALAATDVMLEIANDNSGTDVILELLAGGQMRLKDGTAAAPVVAPRADPDTGLYFGSAKVALAVSGSEVLQVLLNQVRASGQIGSQLYDMTPTSSDSNSNTFAIDWDNGNNQRITLDKADNTLTMTNGVAGFRYMLIVKQDAGGYGDITWPNSAVSSQNPTVSPNSTTVFDMLYDGTKYINRLFLGFSG